METEHIRAKYEPRILSILDNIRQEIKAFDSQLEVSETDDWTDEEYTWNFTAGSWEDESDPNIVDIRFTIVESDVREGSDEGISFMLDFTAYGGRPLGSFAPYNYSEQLWIPLDDEDGIEQRFAMFEQLDWGECASTVVGGL